MKNFFLFKYISTISFLVIFLLLTACSVPANTSLISKDQCSELIGNYYHVPKENVQVLKITKDLNKQYQVKYIVKKDANWEPSDGYYMAQINTDKSGKFSITINKFKDN